MSDITIFHNPRCSKCRTTLQILREKGLEPNVVEYLQSAPSAAQLREVLRKLGLPAEQIVRKGEAVYKEKYEGKTLTDEQWIGAMIEDPVLIERPIVIRGDRAVIGRPPENVLALL